MNRLDSLETRVNSLAKSLEFHCDKYNKDTNEDNKWALLELVGVYNKVASEYNKVASDVALYVQATKLFNSDTLVLQTY